MLAHTHTRSIFYLRISECFAKAELFSSACAEPTRKAKELCRTPCTSEKQPPSAASTVANQLIKTPNKA